MSDPHLNAYVSVAFVPPHYNLSPTNKEYINIASHINANVMASDEATQGTGTSAVAPGLADSKHTTTTATYYYYYYYYYYYDYDYYYYYYYY